MITTVKMVIISSCCFIDIRYKEQVNRLGIIDDFSPNGQNRRKSMQSVGVRFC